MKTKITEKNLDEVAKELVKFLTGKTFTVASFYVRAGEPEDPTAISSRRLAFRTPDGYTKTNGLVRIHLEPSRKITIDPSSEKVAIDYVSERVVILEKILPRERVIYRVMVVVE